MNPLQQLQEDVAAMLLGNPATLAVPFTSFRKQVIESLQDEALGGWKVRAAGKVGMSCLVLMPSTRIRYPNVPGPQYEVVVTVRTMEDPRVNNTGLGCEDVAMANLAWLDGMQILDLTELTADDQGDALRPNTDYPGLLVYDSVLKGQMPQDAKARTAPAVITDDDAGNVSLACSDVAAGIFYTLDGTMPVPGAPGGQVGQNSQYEGEKGSTLVYQGQSFFVPDSTVLRVVCWNPERLPSHVDKATIHITLQ